MDARRANDRIAEKAQRLRFLSRVPMMCECDRSDCRTIVMIGLDDYTRVRGDPTQILTAPGHPIEGTELQENTSSYSVRRPPLRNGEGNGDRRSA